MAKMNVNLTLTKDYRKNDYLAAQKNKPKTNPISSKAKMSLKSLAKKSGNTLYKLLCRYSLDGKHCDGIIAEIY